jgi:L-lactate dehydrogenase complex protein LldF
MEPRCHDFPRNVERALANRNLQEAISRTTGRFHAHREGAVRSFPGDFEAAREAASRLKSSVLRDLDRHLARFIDEAERRGASVHIARDAAEARDIAVRIARDEGIALAVKSKSMATEEIGLNEALEAAGIEAVESDLGEYIIQLAGEPPSHLIAPAVHKTREEVARLFADKLGERYTEEIPELVAIARRRLREKFLSAGMGISGANFLVAESGSVAIVSNEANARMATTLPRVHLAVASIEKVIPLLSDLPPLLRLLTRSATGQPISSYVSVLTGVRRPGDAEGPSKLHVLLVDNGRSAILKGKYREILKCIRCGACLNICPVYQSIGGHAYGWVYPGPMGSVLSPLLLGLREASPLPDASTLCGACADVCPVKIPLPDLLLELRADARAQGRRTPAEVLGMKGFAAVMGRAGFLEALERIGGVVCQLLFKDGKIPWLPFGLSGWTDRRDFPAPAQKPFRKLWKTRRGVLPWSR